MSHYYDKDELDYKYYKANDGLRSKNFGYFYDAGRPGRDTNRHRDDERREYESEDYHDDRDDYVHDDRHVRQGVHLEPVDGPDPVAASQTPADNETNDHLTQNLKVEKVLQPYVGKPGFRRWVM